LNHANASVSEHSHIGFNSCSARLSVASTFASDGRRSAKELNHAGPSEARSRIRVQLLQRPSILRRAEARSESRTARELNHANASASEHSPSGSTPAAPVCRSRASSRATADGPRRS